MKLFLPLYLLLFFGLAMALPSYRIWKTTGVNPYKLGSSDAAHDYIGRILLIKNKSAAGYSKSHWRIDCEPNPNH